MGVIFQLQSYDTGSGNQRGTQIDPKEQNMKPIGARTSLLPNVYKVAHLYYTATVACAN